MQDALSVIDIHKHSSSDYVREINAICQPLFFQLGINYFDYARFYDDNTSILLYTDSDWVNYFLNNAQYAKPTSVIQPGANLWHQYIDINFINIAKEQFNHEHGLTLCYSGKNYQEVFNYSAPSHNRDILYFYLNQTHFFESFAQYFLEKTKKIREKLEANKIKLNNKIEQDNFQTHHSKLMSKLNEMKRIISNQAAHDSLTDREQECLMLLLTGKTAKEIGLKLGISNRTAERHIGNIKEKHSCKKTSELIIKFNHLIESPRI